MKRFLPFLIFATPSWAALDPADTYQPRNTQAPGQEPPPPAEMLKFFKTPPGFHVTLFAGEPDVRQPIDMKLDAKGRLWVCESYSYKEWKKKGEDRIIILADNNGDGVADARKIFRSGFHHLSSVELCPEGVWVLDTPNLLFIPDKNQDDVPDGEPVVHLDGWTEQGGHNLVNGLTWGPDGWLHGRHGITQPSLVGKPGTPQDQRTFVEPGIWRYDRHTGRFECLVKGSTNPWGLDWNAHGEMFMSGNVNGHLWHCLPGSLFERMFGAGSVPHDYERLTMIGEAPHYLSSGDWKIDWNKKERGHDAANDLGGGHSHAGLMIYQGDNWPKEYQGQIFMCNTHGRRINQESLAVAGCSYTSKHIGDPFRIENPWFRGVGLISGPDGGVFLSDWCDNGECHDDDGVHRTSGRIYKITYGKPTAPTALVDLNARTSAELAALMTHENEWMARQARLILAHRTLEEADVAKVRTVAEKGTTVEIKLRAWQTLLACRKLSAADINALFESGETTLAAFAIHAAFSLEQAGEAQKAVSRAEILSKNPRLFAHWLGRAPKSPATLQTALAALSPGSLQNDPRLELFAWHALEPMVEQSPADFLTFLPKCPTPKLRRFIARRLMALPQATELAGNLLGQCAEGTADAASVLQGIQEGLVGKRLAAPSNWPQLMPRLLEKFPLITTEIGLAFGDAGLLEKLRQNLGDAAISAAQRTAALDGLLRAKVPDAAALLDKAFADKTLRLAALRGFAAISDAAVPEKILAEWQSFSPEEISAAVDTLAARRASAKLLTAALASGKLPRGDISLAQARQLKAFRDKEIDAALDQHWGKLGSTNEERQAEISRYKRLLENQKGDAAAGKAVFAKACAACHVIFGEGGKLGPDLTGTGRKDLDYVLINLIDPNAVVPRDYQMTLVTLKDGRVISGTVPAEDEHTLTVQNLAERLVLAKNDVAKIERQPVSWMPEGLLGALSESEIRDLVAFLATP